MDIGGKDLIFLHPPYKTHEIIDITKKFFQKIWPEVVFEWDKEMQVLDIHRNQKIFENWETDPTGLVSLYLADVDTITFVIESLEETEKMINELVLYMFDPDCLLE